MTKKTAAPIYKMKAKLADSETMLLHEENMANTLTANLNALMYSDLSRPFAIDTNNVMKNYRGVNFHSVKDSIENKRSDIQRMNNQISSMKLNQTLTLSQAKPEYGFRFDHSSSFGSTGGNMYAVMAQVKIPVSWSTRGYKSEVKAMGFDITAMEQDKQAMVSMAANMVNMLALELNTEYTELKNYSERVIPAYKKSFDANLLAYSQNTGDLMRAVLSWDDLQMAQMEYLRHLSMLLKAQADYEREMQIR